jgi:hypothetical protein
MKAPLLVLAAVFVSACGTAAAAPAPEPATPADLPSVSNPGSPEPEPAAVEEAPKAEAEAEHPTRSVGDFVVYRFSGSFRKHPIVLTEKVVAREGEILVIDYTLEEDGKKKSLRVRTGSGAGEKGDVIWVATLDGATEHPSSIAQYEALMARTVLTADRNEDFLGSQEVAVEVGGKTISATRSSFRVQVGKHRATMTVTGSEAFPWGDVGGDIVTEKGKVLYKAQIVDMGSTKTAPAVFAEVSE